MGYAGLLLGPVIIGMLTHTRSLRMALTITIALGLLIALTSFLLPAPSPARGDGGSPPRLISAVRWNRLRPIRQHQVTNRRTRRTTAPPSPHRDPAVPAPKNSGHTGARETARR
jgi:hypothetical protein